MKNITLFILTLLLYIQLLAQDPAYPVAAATPGNIVYAEYFFNTDPGFGNGTAIAITAGIDITLTPALITSALPAGPYRLFLRTRNTEGKWSITSTTSFSILSTIDPPYPAAPATVNNITYAEYFFDADPGFGNGTPIVITPGTDLNNINFTATASALPVGTHNLLIRSFDDWSITNHKTFTVTSVLPVKLLSFAATTKNNDISVTWETENEINSSHFDIEFSVDGIQFSKINTVPSKNTTTKNTYSFTHVFPAGDVLYYRLKQVDLNGKFEYSDIAKVSRMKIVTISVYPNPAGNFIQLKNIIANELQQLQVFAADGSMVLAMVPNNQQQYNISNLKPGIYNLKLFKRDKRILSIPFHKQ